MWQELRRDFLAVLERDPAAKSPLEVLLVYPGFHAIVLHRMAHALYRSGLTLVARLIAHFSRWLTGIEIHPGAKLGAGLFIDHGMGVVIGETAVVGENVTLYKGVVLGGTGKEKGKRHPTIGDHVVISTNAVVLGAIEIGDHTKIGAGSVVLHSVPPNCTVVGVPGRIVRRDGRKVQEPDLDQVNLPDPVAEMLYGLQRDMNSLAQRLRMVEQSLAGTGAQAASAAQTATAAEKTAESNP